MVFAGKIIERLKNDCKSIVTLQNLSDLDSLRQSYSLMLQVKILVEVERGAVDKM